MDQPINIGTFQKGRIFTLREIIAHLRNTYCGAIGFEYQHIDNLEIRSWIEEKIDRRADGVDYGPETRRDAFIHLCKAELFEEFLGKRFIGEKRFSLEGGKAPLSCWTPWSNAVLRQPSPTWKWAWPTGAGSTCWQTSSTSR